MTQPTPPPRGFSRRSFLKGASAVAAGSTVGSRALAGDGPGSSARAGATVFAPAERHAIELQVNGQKRKIEVETRTTLLDALRDHLDLTGTKKVCDRGACGGCTVMLDGNTVNSCMTLAFDAVGTEITTIEGIGTMEEPHAMQRAFVECDALQCGFCTPGMVVSAVACVERHGRPTEEQMRREMAGNLCRCGTYTRVFEAIERASTANGGGK